MLKFSEQQVKSVSPDHKIDAAQNISDLGRWFSLGSNSNALWGNFQGSEETPYQVVLTATNDTDPAPQIQYTCTCKSRKQPCKHVLALMLLSADQNNFQSVPDGSEPSFVQELKSASTVKDPKAQAKRLEQRLNNVLEGAEFLETWIKDTLRVGLNESCKRWDSDEPFADIAKRLADFQAPNLADKLTNLNNAAFKLKRAESGSPGYTLNSFVLLNGFAELFMICRSLHSYNQLPADWQGELRHLVGINERKADILSQPGIHDSWLFFRKEKYTKHVERLTKYTYLCLDEFCAYGLASKQFVYLQFYYVKELIGAAPKFFEQGKIYDGTMHVYPSVGSIRRALFRPDNKSFDKFESEGAGEGEDLAVVLKRLGVAQAEDGQTNSAPNGAECQNFEQLLEARKQYYAANPFASDFLAQIHNVSFANQKVLDDGITSFKWYLVDCQGKAIQLRNMSSHEFPDIVYHIGDSVFSAFVKFNEDCPAHQEGAGLDLVVLLRDGKTMVLKRASEPDSYDHYLSKSTLSLIHQAQVGTLHNILDLSLFAEPLQSHLKKIFEQSSDPDAVFLQGASIVFNMLKLDSVKEHDIVIPEQVEQGAVGLYLPMGEIVPLRCQLKNYSGCPEFPDEVTGLLDDLTSLKQEIEANSKLYWYGTFFLLDFWFLQQLMPMGMRFNSDQNCRLFLVEQTDRYTTSALSLSPECTLNQYEIGFDKNLPLFGNLQKIAMLLQLGGNNLWCMLPGISSRTSHYVDAYQDRLLRDSDVVRIDGSLDLKEMFTKNVSDWLNYIDFVPQILIMIRQDDPALARDLIEANFEKLQRYMSNADEQDDIDREDWVLPFAINLSQEDEDFLTNLRKQCRKHKFRENILNLLRYIPNSKYAVSCMDLWKKQIRFNEAKDQWDLSGVKHGSKFTTLGIGKPDNSLSDAAKEEFLVFELFQGLGWDQIKEVTGAVDAKEALRRWSKFPYIASGKGDYKFAYVLTNKMVYAAAYQDAELVLQNPELIELKILPLALLEPQQRRVVIEQLHASGKYVMDSHDFFSVKLQDGRLVCSLIEDDELLQVLLDCLYDKNSMLALRLPFIAKAMSPQSLPWLEQRLEGYKQKLAELDKMASEHSSDSDDDPVQMERKQVSVYVERLHGISKILAFKKRVTEVLEQLK